MSEITADEEKKISIPPYGELLFICCAIAGACYFGSYTRVPVVPLYARSFGADALQVGMINSAFLFMAGIVSLPLGVLSDRLGRKRLILAGLALCAASSFLLCFSTSTSEMIEVYLLFGISMGMFGPTMMSYVADITPATHLGRAYGWYTLALNVGMSVGPATGGLVAEWLGFRPVFILSGIALLVIFLSFRKIVPAFAKAKASFLLSSCFLQLTVAGFMNNNQLLTLFPFSAEITFRDLKPLFDKCFLALYSLDDSFDVLVLPLTYY